MHGFFTAWLRSAYLMGCFCLALGVAGARAQEPETPPQAETEAADEARDQGEASININLADAGLIAESLEGIGTVRAEAIIRYRAENGEFRSLDELGEVRGVGEQTLMRNSERIIFD